MKTIKITENSNDYFITFHENICKAEEQDLINAFNTRNKTSWKHSIRQYGRQWNNIDEVLTHIRFGQMNNYNPHSFAISMKHTI